MPCREWLLALLNLALTFFLVVSCAQEAPAPAPTRMALAIPRDASTLANSVAGAVIRDPNASFFDVRARRAYLSTATDSRLQGAMPSSRDCTRLEPVPPPKGRMVIPPFYLSGSSGPINPDYAPAERPYTQFEYRLGLLAGLYVRFGEPSYARCLVDLVRAWAQAGALLGYDVAESQQAWFQVEWSAAAAALTYSIVRADSVITSEDHAQVEGWLNRVARRQISFPGGASGASPSCCNNHAYWRGLEAVAVGLVSNDEEMFRWGLSKYYQALSHMAEDGSWPYEMARHERALHYQNFALEPLVMIAELADRQGINLYDASLGGRSLHRAVAFLVAALEDPTRVKKYAREEQYVASFEPGKEDLGWMELYRRRYASPDLSRFLTKPVTTVRLGGNITLYSYRPAGE